MPGALRPRQRHRRALLEQHVRRRLHLSVRSVGPRVPAQVQVKHLRQQRRCVRLRRREVHRLGWVRVQVVKFHRAGLVLADELHPAEADHLQITQPRRGRLGAGVGRSRAVARGEKAASLPLGARRKPGQRGHGGQCVHRARHRIHHRRGQARGADQQGHVGELLVQRGHMAQGVVLPEVLPVVRENHHNGVGMEKEEVVQQDVQLRVVVAQFRVVQRAHRLTARRRKWRKGQGGVDAQVILQVIEHVRREVLGDGLLRGGERRIRVAHHGAVGFRGIIGDVGFLVVGIQEKGRAGFRHELRRLAGHKIRLGVHLVDVLVEALREAPLRGQVAVGLHPHRGVARLLEVLRHRFRGLRQDQRALVHLVGVHMGAGQQGGHGRRGPGTRRHRIGEAHPLEGRKVGHQRHPAARTVNPVRAAGVKHHEHHVGRRRGQSRQAGQPRGNHNKSAFHRLHLTDPPLVAPA